MQKKIETLNISRGILSKSESLSRLAGTMCDKIVRINDLSNISMQLYGLYLKLGYTRTQKDIDLIIQVYGQKLAKYEALRRRGAVIHRAFFPLPGQCLVQLHSAQPAAVL
ncbi:MAG: hypothetical protein ACLR8Y_13890 [Alistipes indistinctus]